MGVRAKPEFVYQDCVKLIGHCGAHKHSCALKSLSIQNTCSITNFLPTSLTTCLKSKIKSMFKVKWMKQWRKFFSSKMSAPWCDQLSKGVNKLTRRKNFLWHKFPLRECLWVGNVRFVNMGHLFYFCFMETYRLFTDFKVILHVPIWALLILGTHPFSRSNLS